MREKMRPIISKLSHLLEIATSLIIIAAVAMGVFHMAVYIFTNGDVDQSKFETFFANIMSMVVGLEFVKMLVRQTPAAVLDVLLFAVARQIIIYHHSALDNLVGVIAVAGLFAIRKYLFVVTFGICEKDKNKAVEDSQMHEELHPSIPIEGPDHPA